MVLFLRWISFSNWFDLVCRFGWAEYSGKIVPIPGAEVSNEYLMQVTLTQCIDASEDTGFGRSINHASGSKANLETRTEQVGFQWRVFLYATRDILPDEELLYNYKAADWDEPWLLDEVSERTTV